LVAKDRRRRFGREREPSEDRLFWARERESKAWKLSRGVPVALLPMLARPKPSSDRLEFR
jgi:hypothetical protein